VGGQRKKIMRREWEGEFLVEKGRVPEGKNTARIQGRSALNTRVGERRERKEQNKIVNFCKGKKGTGFLEKKRPVACQHQGKKGTGFVHCAEKRKKKKSIRRGEDVSLLEGEEGGEGGSGLKKSIAALFGEEEEKRGMGTC